jgi:hypothetical protein
MMAMSVLDALQPAGPDAMDTMRRQRAVAKVCVATIQKVDGFRYSFHNSWRSGEDDAFRFSFYCNDSLLNKDRVASGKANSTGKRAHKPVYDCKGVLSIKFSSTRQCMEVIYKHIPIHATYEERAPPPRKEAKRRAEWEAKNPDKVRRPKPPEEKEARPKKRQRKSAPAYVSLESELLQESRASLLELIRVDQEPEEPSPPAPVPVPAAALPPPPPQTRNDQNDNVEQRAMEALTLNANSDLRREVEKLKANLDVVKKELEDERARAANFQERCTQLEAENQTLREASTASRMQEAAPPPPSYPSQMMSMPPRHTTSQSAQPRQQYPHYANRPGSEYFLKSIDLSALDLTLTSATSTWANSVYQRSANSCWPMAVQLLSRASARSQHVAFEFGAIHSSMRHGISVPTIDTARFSSPGLLKLL